jgi:hypothetical protein
MTKADNDPPKPLITLLSFFSTVGVLINQGRVINLAEALNFSGLEQPRPLELSSDFHTLYRRKGGLVLRRHRQNQVFFSASSTNEIRVLCFVSRACYARPCLLGHVNSASDVLCFVSWDWVDCLTNQSLTADRRVVALLLLPVLGKLINPDHTHVAKEEGLSYAWSWHIQEPLPCRS